jgi:hypothetical protein
VDGKFAVRVNDALRLFIASVDARRRNTWRLW